MQAKDKAKEFFDFFSAPYMGMLSEHKRGLIRKTRKESINQSITTAKDIRDQSDDKEYWDEVINELKSMYDNN